MTVYEDLEWRGLIKDISSSEIKNILNNQKVCFYWGTDPTADSLHLGHYSSLVTAKRLADYGHHPILLVGGATGLVGDPRPTSEREIMKKDVLDNNLKGISKQIDKIFDGRAEVVNNYDWMKDISFLDFIRDVGKYININYMLDKDIIRRRLETGITYAEFSYTLMQGFDFLHLFQEKNCILQVEGSDQWGNITTGIDLIRKKLDKTAYGFTMPLILDSYGNKFGKSEGNALWLDKEKTSSYQLYQYLINTDDKMVIHYLKVFTFLSREEIEELERKNNLHPEKREAHQALAREIITDLHGSEEYERAKVMSESLFSEDITKLPAEDIIDCLKDIPTFEINEDISLVEMLVNNNICSSKREAREMISSGAISLNNKKVTDLEKVITKEDSIENKIIIVKKGKKKYYLGFYK